MAPKESPPRLTHFLCLPLITPSSILQLQTSLTTFRTYVAETRIPGLPSGLPGKAIRPIGTLHLTLGVMSLLTRERVDSALKMLNELNLEKLLTNTHKTSTPGSKTENVDGEGKGKGKQVDEETNPTSLLITLRGLISMHTPSKASILYSSPVDPNQELYNFCLQLRDNFASAGLLIEDNRPLLLHATIVNTVYVPGVRGRGSGSGHGRSRAKLTFDAREMLEDFGDLEWMKDIRLEKVAICRMGAKANGDGDEEYIVEGAVDMP